MRSPKPSAPADKVVRKRLADGSIREYRYPRARTRQAPGTIGALLTAYKGSPEWTAKAPATRKTQTIYLKHLESLAHLPVADVKRRMLLAVRDGLAAGRRAGHRGPRRSGIVAQRRQGDLGRAAGRLAQPFEYESCHDTPNRSASQPKRAANG